MKIDGFVLFVWQFHNVRRWLSPTHHYRCDLKESSWARGQFIVVRWATFFKEQPTQHVWLQVRLLKAKALKFRQQMKTKYCSHQTGNWSSPAPTCLPIQCPPLFLEDPHLSLIELNTSAWGRAVFSCSWGYRLSGPPNLECLSSGHWSGPIPRCRGECWCCPPVRDISERNPILFLPTLLIEAQLGRKLNWNVLRVAKKNKTNWHNE